MTERKYTMATYKSSSWYVDAEGKPSAINSRFHDDRYEAERQFHLYCASAATSEHPLHVSLLETIDGTQLKRECYRHEVALVEEEPIVEEPTEAE